MTPNSKKVPANPAAATPPAEPKPVRKGKAILIVEDEKPLSHALEMKLKSQGFEAVVSMNGENALSELKKGGYALVLLDLIMPIMDGFAVLEEMKKQKIKIPVIVLSNLGQDEDHAKAKDLGAIDYFVKSNTPIAEIVNRVKSVL
jgi:DNA-binding response OmpR family regulator